MAPPDFEWKAQSQLATASAMAKRTRGDRLGEATSDLKAIYGKVPTYSFTLGAIAALRGENSKFHLPIKISA